VPRDRRWDHLYDRQKQPVKQYLLERFAEELAADLAAWPPPFVEWIPDELRARWAAGMRDRPREAVVRLALEAARLDLAREFEAVERRLDAERPRLGPGEEEAVHLLVRFLTEKCLALKEHAEGARLARDDLAGALRRAERRLFLVTP
jgi:hypothetical protein